MRENFRHILQAIKGSENGRFGMVSIVLIIFAVSFCTCENLIYPSEEEEYRNMKKLAEKGNTFVYSNQTDSALACYSQVLSKCDKELPDSYS